MQSIQKLSDIQIAENRKANLQFLNNQLKRRQHDFPAPAYFMLLGAGCSIAANIPSGGGIIDYLQKRSFAQWHLTYKDEIELEYGTIEKLFETDKNKEDLEKFIEEKQKICQNNIDSQKEELIDTIPKDLKNQLEKTHSHDNLWDAVKDEFYRASYYSFWFENTLPSPRERQQFIEKIIDKKEPSAAYFLLACAVQKDIFRTFFTTNFDDLINDAILQETGKKSRVYAHNEVVRFINFRSERPNIIKLHGDFLYQDMKNTLKETSALQDDQLFKLEEASQDMGVIIVGYSGADLSIMDALHEIKAKKGADFRLFWCARSEESLSWRAKHLINSFENSYFVATDGFEQLMHSIYLDLDCKIRDLKEKTDRVEQNHKKATDLLDKLNKKVTVPDFLESKKEKLEDDLSVDEIISKAKQKEKLEDRVDFLTLGIEKYPMNYLLYHWRGNYFYDYKKYQEAIKDYDKAIELNPSYATAYNNRGLSKNNLNLYQEAIKDYDKAIELNPNDAIIYHNRGCAKNDLKLYQEAIKDYDKAIELDPNYAIAYHNRGCAKNDLKLYQEAIKDLDKAIELKPNNAIAYTNRGFAKNDLKLYQEAIKDLDKAIELDSNYPNSYRHKGKSLLKLSKLEESEKSIRKAIELDINYANAYIALAEWYYIQHEIDKFYENFEIALQKEADLEFYKTFDDEMYEPLLKEKRFQELLKTYKKEVK